MTGRAHRRRVSRATRLARRVTRTDQCLLAAATRHRTPARDRTLTGLSRAADNGVLWAGIAAALSLTGQRRPRTAAAGGLLGLAVASTVVNGPLKFVWQRDRPPVPAFGGRAPLLPLPRTYSFPSGHSASAFAFATGASLGLPPAAPALLPLAGAVGYSRVHTGVHYPSDVVVGAALGVGAGVVGAQLAARARASAVHFADVPPAGVRVPRRAVVLSSPRSGTAGGLSAALEALARDGVEVVEHVAITDLDRLGRVVRDTDPPPLVIAAGGDGTVGAAVNAVAGTGAVVAIIPLGTSNDIARSLGVSPDPVEAAQLVTHGVVRVVDLGSVRVGDGDERLFANAATVGLNVAFARLATAGRLRARFGGLTYPVAAALAIRHYEPFECTVEHEGRRSTFSVVHLSASNATVFGGLLGMRVPGASITDGKLDVIVVERLSLARLSLAVGNTLIGRHTPVHRVHALQVDSLRVSSPSSHQVAADGEILGDLPVEFGIRPGALRVVTPERAGE